MNKKVLELFQVASFETKNNNFDKAIKVYESILKLPHVSKRAIHLSHWGIGEIYLNTQHYKEAEHHLSKVVELSPKESYYQYLLGCTYTYQNQIEKAIYHLEKALKLDDSIEIYWAQLGWVVGHNKNIELGIKYLKKSLCINPNHYPSLRDLCMLYSQDHKFSEALICIEEAERQNKDNKEIQIIKRQIEHFKSEFERLSESIC